MSARGVKIRSLAELEAKLAETIARRKALEKEGKPVLYHRNRERELQTEIEARKRKWG